MLSEAVRQENRAEPRPSFEVHNPATGQKIADVPIYSPAEVKDAVDRMRVAQKEWATLSFKERGSRLYKLRRLMLENREKLIDVVVSENGKARMDVYAEILYIADLIGYYVKNAPRFLADKKASLHLLKTKRAYVSYHPMGVVGVISPWNYPLNLPFGDVITALVAGNAAVLKPSEITPLTALTMGEHCKQAGLPVEIVTGLGETGGALVDYADLIAFTGSVATGKRIMERAAKTLTPVLLELGGKDPMIVLKDADLDRSVSGALYGGFFNAGQTCISVERIYVEEPIYDQFVAKLREGVAKLRQGIETAGEADIEIGPMTMPRQLDIVEQQIEDAKAKGATVLTGGKRRSDLSGLFYEPTILTDVSDDMQIMQEETFGPVLPVIKVRDAEEAIRKANDSRFGLSSSIWTRDTSKGEALARRVEAGSTCVNDVLINYLALEVPFGGIKESGFGARHGGPEGLRKFCRTQSILVDRFQLKREMFWYPYNKRTARLLGTVLDIMFKRGK
jgi:acyl-CoA reductase-like NAD-dependent aldehyde dehydrogenase